MKQTKIYLLTKWHSSEISHRVILFTSFAHAAQTPRKLI
jgi:hypothetical protein